MLTIEPPSASIGASAWVRKKTPLKWTLTSSSKSASVTVGERAAADMPPLLTRKSKRSRPQFSWSASATAAAKAGNEDDDADVERERDGGAPERGDLRDDRGGLVGVGTVGEDHVDAAAGEVQRGAAPDAAVAAGDQGDAGVRGHATMVGRRARRDQRSV